MSNPTTHRDKDIIREEIRTLYNRPLETPMAKNRAMATLRLELKYHPDVNEADRQFCKNHTEY